MGIDKKKILNILKIIFQVFIVIALIVYLFPIIWSIIASFKTGADTFSFPPKIIFHPTLEAYKYVIQEMHIFDYLLNSIITAGASTVIAIIIAMFFAYALVRFNWRGKESIAFTLLTFKMMPAIAAIIPIYLLYTMPERFLGFNLVDTRIGLVLIYLFFNLPFSIWILRSFFEKIPKEIEDAALVDGCSRTSMLFRIIIPMSRPGFVATAFFNLIFSWNEFLFALILTDQNARTLPVEVSKLMTLRTILWNQMGVIAVFCLVPVVIFSIFARNHLVTGLTLGSISE